MAKHLNVNLAFTADTNAAKTQIKDLQNQLSNLMGSVGKNSSFGITDEVKKASSAVATLQSQLKNAINTDTGKLNLTEFNKSMRKSNMRLKDYKTALTSLGPEGAQAFATLAQAITKADMPLRRSNTLLGELWTTMKNTARWQLTSSVLHGFMGGIQSAIGYAQDLNKTLTDIRIVAPEKSMEDMYKFAKLANEQAKELSASTLDYAKGALIYYQQGLGDAEVKERTDVTTKMMNVTGDSADEVSSYMTAIWNNFNKNGDKAAEHYGDILTKLGADTAASTTEITTALEKYSAVANTIGLSYEAATAAATTLIDRTRETPEVAGTALKTIFARIEGLKQDGTTSEGGTETSYNKYSQALANIGVEIKNVNGEMKDADVIIDEIGAKWNTLAQDQKIALAETVAGVRQWNQFAALMENFDYYKEYKQTAETGSDGSLQEQQDIYAESWEAARDRVSAAIEEIYSQLLDDKFFIKLTDGAASFLNIISDVIDSLGGLKGVLLLIGTIITSKFSNQMASGIQDLVFNIQSLTKDGREKAANQKAEANKELQTLMQSDKSSLGVMAGAAYASQGDVANDLIEKSSTLTKQQQEIAAILVDQHNTLVANAIEQGNVAKEAEKTANLAKRQATAQFEPGHRQSVVRTGLERYQQRSATENLVNEFSGMTMDPNKIGQEASQISKKISTIFKTLENEGNTAFDVFGKKGAKALQDFQKALEKADGDAIKIEEALSNLMQRTNINAFERRLQNLGVSDEILAEIRQAGIEMSETASRTADAAMNADDFAERLNKIPSGANAIINSLVGLSSGLMAVSMAASSLIGLGNTVQGMIDGEIGKVEGIISILSTLGILLMTLQQLREANILSSVKEIGAIILTTAAHKGLITIKTEETVATEELTVANIKAAVSEYALLAPILLIIAALGALALIIWGVSKALNIHNEKLANAKEELAAANEEATKTKQAYDDLKSSIESLKGSETALKSMTKGTQEWKEAVLDLNNQVLALVKQYPELAKYMSNEDGHLSIDSEGYDYILDQQMQKANAAQQEVMNKQIAVAQAENVVLKDDVLSNTHIKGFNDKAGIDALTEAYQTRGSEIFADDASNYFGDIAKGQNVLEFLGEDLNTVETYLAEILANTSGIDTIAEDTAASWMEANGMSGEYQDDKYSYMIDKKFADIDASKYENNYKGEHGEINLTEQDLEDYARLTGKISQDQKLSDIDGSQRLIDGGLKYKDETGETQKVDASEIIEVLSQRDASDAAGEEGMQASILLNEMSAGLTTNLTGAMIGGEEASSEDAEAATDAFIQLMQGNADGYANLNERQQELVNTLLDTCGSFDELQKMTGLTTEQLKELGFTSEIDTDQLVKDGQNLQVANGAANDAMAGIDPEQLNQVYQQWQNGDTEGAAERARQLAGLPDSGWWSEEGKEAGLKWQDAFNAQMEEMQGDTEDYKTLADNYGLDADELEDYTDNLMENADAIDYLDDNLSQHEDIAQDVAKAQMRCQRAVDKVTDSVDDWRKTLKKSNKGTAEWSKAINEVKDTMGDLLDIDASSLSDDFAQNAENLDLMEQAANGSEEAIDQLRMNAQEDILQQCGVSMDDTDFRNTYDEVQALLDKKNFDDIEVGADLKGDGFLNKCTELVNSAHMTAQQAEDYLTAMGIDAEIEEVPVPAEETTTETQNVEYRKRSKKFSVPELDLAGMVDGTGGRQSVSNHTYEITYPEAVAGGTAITKTKKSEGKATALKVIGATKSGGGNISVARKSGRTGGSRSGRRSSRGSSRTATRAQNQYEKSDVIKRYKEKDDSLNRISRASDRLSKVYDSLYGKSRLKQMDQINKKHLEEIKMLQKKAKEARQYQLDDKAAMEQRFNELKKIATGTGDGAVKAFDAKHLTTAQRNAIKNISLQINSATGDVTNYTTTMKALQDELNAFERYYNNSKNFNDEESQNEFKEKNIDPLKEAIDRYQEALDQYDETRELIEELKDSIEESFITLQDENYERLNYSLELKVAVNENDLSLLEYNMNKMSDNVYKAAEMLGDYFNGDLNNDLTGKFGLTTEAVKDQTKYFEELTDAYQNGQISQINYMEGLQNVYDNIFDNLNTIIDLKEEMKDYYSNTLSQVIEQLDKYNDRLDTTTSLLDHYQSVLNLTGKGKNYNLLEQLYGANVAAQTAKINQTKATYEMLKDDLYGDNGILSKRNEARENWILSQSDEGLKNLREKLSIANDVTDEALKTIIDEQYNYYDNAYNAALESYQEAEEQMFSSVEEALESAASQLETALERAAKAVEDALTGIIGGFEELSRQMDLTSTRQEEYLTKTNQGYELNKMQRTLNKDMEKTDSKSAKLKLANFSKELKALEEKDELSNLELEIAQKKYELLKAQIALEESQNAKQTIRLTRDNEGNYGYVYVANEENVEEAKQAVEDANNDLYNLQLEATNDYGQKYLEAIQEYKNTLNEFYNSDEYKEMTDLERDERVSKIQDQYNQILNSYKDLYGIAYSSTDYLTDALKNDAWIYRDYNNNIEMASNNMSAFDSYIKDASNAISIWSTQVKNITDQVKFDDRMENVVTTTEDTVNAITKEFEQTGEILNQTLDDVINKISSFIDTLLPSLDNWTVTIEDTLAQINALLKAGANGKIDQGTGNFNKFMTLMAGKDASQLQYTDNHIAYGKFGVTKNANGWSADTINSNNVIAGELIDAYETGKSGYFGFDSNGLLHYMIGNTSSNAYKALLQKVKSPQAFASGGYTGDWSDDGKLAILHEKELVLNANDTSNILAVVDSVRQLAATGFLSALVPGNVVNRSTSQQQLEQNVQIDAQFPNVTDRHEIEQAFNNLVNRAAQHAYNNNNK